jgi:ankyrin repeat protein
MQVNEVDKQGFTALHIAADRNLAAIAGLLLAQGATVDTLDTKGRSPLLLAARCGHVPMVQLLLGRYPSFSLYSDQLQGLSNGNQSEEFHRKLGFGRRAEQVP